MAKTGDAPLKDVLVNFKTTSLIKKALKRHSVDKDYRSMGEFINEIIQEHSDFRVTLAKILKEIEQ